MKLPWRAIWSGTVRIGTNGQDHPRTNGDHPQDRTGTAVRTKRSWMPDRPVRPEISRLDRDRQPLVPAIYRKDQLKAVWDHARYTAKFHAIRSPLYFAQNLAWSFRGAVRATVGVVRWAQDVEHLDYELAAADQAMQSGNWQPASALADQRRARVRSRMVPAVLGPVLVLVLAGLGLASGWWSRIPTVLVLVFGLGWCGRPMDRPYVESAVVSVPRARRITEDQIIRALYRSGLCKESDPEPPVIVGARWGRVDDGWGGVVDLPGGTTATHAIGFKEKIASALKVSNFCLFMDPVEGSEGAHAGLVRIWVADKDPHTRPPVPSPLVKAQTFSLWDPVPFGRDERGRPVSFPIVWTSVLIGALPRLGKTNAVRLLVAAAALDVYARLLIFDGKGGADLSDAEKVCHAFGAGADDDVAKALVAALTELVAEMRRRYRKLRREIPKERAPKAKLTPGLASDPDVNMPLVVVVIDEFQEYLENRAYGRQIEELLTTLVKVGPASGIIVILSTQRPSSRTMATDLRDVLGTRFCMMVTTREFSEMVLGSGTYKKGWDASLFLKEHLGVGILRGTDDNELSSQGARTVHTYLMDPPEFEVVCNRARALREGAGTLTGVAAGEEPEALSDRFLEHVQKAFGSDDRAHSEVLCKRLAGHYPELYGDPETGTPTWSPKDLATALSRYGVETGNQIWAVPVDGGKACNRKGFYLQQIIEARAGRVGEVPEYPPDDLE